MDISDRKSVNKTIDIYDKAKDQTGISETYFCLPKHCVNRSVWAIFTIPFERNRTASRTINNFDT